MFTKRCCFSSPPLLPLSFHLIHLCSRLLLLVHFSQRLNLPHLFITPLAIERYAQFISLGGSFHFLYNSFPCCANESILFMIYAPPWFLSHLTFLFLGLSLLFVFHRLIALSSYFVFSFLTQVLHSNH